MAYYKFLFPEEEKTDVFENIVSLSYNEVRGDRSLLHTHQYTEIMIPINGFARLLLADGELRMNEGSFYIVPSGVSHTEDTVERGRLGKYYVLKVTDSFSLGDGALSYGGVTALRDEGKYRELLPFLSAASAAHARENDEKYASLALKCFYHAFLKLVATAGAIPTEPRHSPGDAVVEINRYLSVNYHQNIKISDIAELYGISESSLLKRFKRAYGITPKAFLDKCRTEAAKKYLSSLDYTVTQISHECGFQSPAYFTQVFKAEFGMTPREYRKSNGDTDG